MYRKRWIGCGIAALAIASYAMLTEAALTPGESCGLGLPPDAPGFAEAEKREAAEAKKNGFLRVCVSNLKRFDIPFRSLDVTEANLAFLPVDLTRTQFSRFDSLGLSVETIVGVRSRLYRGFRTPDGHTLTLSEHDMSADGTNTWRAPEDEPERINDSRARLSVLQASSGAAISHMSWVEGRRAYELWIDASVARGPLREQLFALAASLPRSVPACPNEPPPRQWRLGPDGRPVDEPVPAVLPVAEMDAMVDRDNRPCK